MARGKKTTFKRNLEPDPIYKSGLLSRFINRIMESGKKDLARKIVYKAFDQIAQNTGKNPLNVFETAIANVAPKMEVRPRRIGGASYMVPMEVRGTRREALAIRWLIDSADLRSNKDYVDRKSNSPIMSAKLAAELTEASEGQGNAVRKKEEMHKSAEANRAFAHFRW